MTSKKDLLKKFLKGIETGDAMAASVVNEDKYIQHNPQTHEGGEGLATLFARLSKTNPKVHFIRVFEDGDFAFAHNEYDFASRRAAFEVFRFEDGRAVEHWDNIQPLKGPNPSNRAMLDGETRMSDLDKTEANRATARTFVEQILIARDAEKLDHFVAPYLIQHNPDLPDGAAAFGEALQAKANGSFRLTYLKLHKVLAEGNFVLCICEGTLDETPTSFYHLYRFKDDMIVEHWDTIEAIPPRSQWKNQNGKFNF